MPDPSSNRDPVNAAELAGRIVAARARIEHRLPDIDPGDLIAILEAVLRPIGSGRRFFLRELRPGIHVP